MKHRSKPANTTKGSISRLVIIGLIVLAEIVWVVIMGVHFYKIGTWVTTLSTLMAVLIVLEIVSAHTNSAFKLPWVIAILVFPLAGLALYLLIGRPGITKRKQRKLEAIGDRLRAEYLKGDGIVSQEEAKKYPFYRQMKYINDDGSYPAWKNTQITFQPSTTSALENLIDSLSKAQKFIFMEYHAIEDAEAFSRIREVLRERASAGVEVRIIYDDLGSVGFLSPVFIHKLREDGIECRVFNPIMPIINVFMNNRDHRKITVIDGQIGFTGGYNLADEYFNIVQPYGEWKDSGLMLRGSAVRSLTVQFLEMWNTIKNTDTEFDKYFFEAEAVENTEGITVPYGDCPLDDIYLGENIYMNMINSAENYIWFMTPYLIINDEMRRALTLAARKGIDVRIFTPGIPDKKFIYRITRSYYYGLVKSGVRIYEFTPGFLHSKQCVCDDKTAVVGTINLDFRSLYFHFENGVFFGNCNSVQDVKLDFDNTMERCREVTGDYQKEPKGWKRLVNQILRLISPVM